MTRIAQVLLPLPLPEAFDYAEPEGMALRVGEHVAVPLGPREVAGVVVGLRDAAGGNRPLKPVLGRLDLPALPPGALSFIDWAARYAVDVPGLPLHMALRGARAPQARPTRRLFYNFYSRSSRETTAWAGAVSPEQIDAARAALPAAYAHLFRLDAAETRRLAAVPGGALRRFGFARSTSEALLRDAVFAWQALGRPVAHPAHPGFLLPYTTRLLEARRFDALEYGGHLRPLTVLRNTAGALRRSLLK